MGRRGSKGKKHQPWIMCMLFNTSLMSSLLENLLERRKKHSSESRNSFADSYAVTISKYFIHNSNHWFIFMHFSLSFAPRSVRESREDGVGDGVCSWRRALRLLIGSQSAYRGGSPPHLSTGLDGNLLLSQAQNLPSRSEAGKHFAGRARECKSEQSAVTVKLTETEPRKLFSASIVDCGFRFVECFWWAKTAGHILR